MPPLDPPAPRECGNLAGETCPACFEAVLRAEHAHGRCDRCGYIGRCCG